MEFGKCAAYPEKRKICGYDGFAEILRRKTLGKQYNSKSIFAAIIVCGDCGNFCGSKVWHSTSKYLQVFWRCNHKFNDVCRCNTSYNDKYEDYVHYRVDKMIDIAISTEKRIVPNGKINAAEYVKPMFSVFDGKVEHITQPYSIDHI